MTAVPEAMMRRCFALFGAAGVSEREDRLRIYSFITWKPVETGNELDRNDMQAVIDILTYWQKLAPDNAELKRRCRKIARNLETS
jgi:hypothetical protein